MSESGGHSQGPNWTGGVVTDLTRTFRGSSLSGLGGTGGNQEFRVRDQREFVSWLYKCGSH